jgi:ribonucleoside-diphosphate reductase alpha chain
MNPFPLPEIKRMVYQIRRIGLGVGGWADMLLELGIAYDSEEALELAGRVMKFVNDKAHEASRRLAKERGPFPMFKESIYELDPHRNSTVTTIAPTGTISIIADASSGIEPVFALAYRHIVKDESLDREMTFVNPIFERVAREGDYYNQEMMDKVVEMGYLGGLEMVPDEVRRVFKTAHEIDYGWHVRMQAAFQKHVDNAVSKTINLRNGVEVGDIQKAYMMAWETGCKGITVFRDGCREMQVLNAGVSQNLESRIQNPEEIQAQEQVQEEGMKPRPVKVEGATYRIATPVGRAFVTVNHTHEGNPFEVFVTVGKAGSEVAAMAEALGRLVSTTLRFGNHLPAKERAAELVSQLRGIGGSKSVGFGANKVRSLPDAVGKAIAMHFGLVGFESDESEAKKVDQQDMFGGNGLVDERSDGQLSISANKYFDLCPECKEPSLVLEEGCKKCYGCGYSEC